MHIKGSYGRSQLLGVKQDYNSWVLYTDPILFVSTPTTLNLFYTNEALEDITAITYIGHPIRTYKFPQDLGKFGSAYVLNLTDLIRKYGKGAYFAVWVDEDGIVPSGQAIASLDDDYAGGGAELTPFCSFDSSLGSINITKGLYVHNPKLTVSANYLNLNYLETTGGT